MKESIAKNLELWTIMTLYNVVLLLLLAGLLLHLAGGYRKNILKSFRINMTKEGWSAIFFVVRDFSLFFSFGISLLLINPDMFADVKFPLPFFPLGVVLLGTALIFKLNGKADNPGLSRNLFFIFLISSALVQYFGFVFVAEAAPAEWVANGYAGNFWLSLRGLRSNLNPQLSMISFSVSFPIIMLILIILFLKFFSGRFTVAANGSTDETDDGINK